jgi:hypothetical protein
MGRVVIAPASRVLERSEGDPGCSMGETLTSALDWHISLGPDKGRVGDGRHCHARLTRQANKAIHRP